MTKDAEIIDGNQLMIDMGLIDASSMDRIFKRKITITIERDCKVKDTFTSFVIEALEHHIEFLKKTMEFGNSNDDIVELYDKGIQEFNETSLTWLHEIKDK